MRPLTVILIAAAISSATVMITVSAIFLALGHVQNDRSTCFLANPGRECGLVWEPLS